ncbi:PhzF family phenazine biosynthesis protein [Acuticoccus sp.]|uniref:PhzF family phenazine biosynthesis protein n=1 Tax=Acuticoccus sp. TaxID=1904378 RepID=UPI003B52A6AB
MRPYQILDVFTHRPLAGNPLAVVFEADELDAAAMQAIAGEFNLSETVFVKRPADADNTAAARIFTPKAEMPFAGHPTLGTAVALARLRGLANVRLELKAGLAVCEVAPGPLGLATVTAPRVPTLEDTPLDLAAVASALSLEPDDLATDWHAPVVGTSGPRFTLVPLASLDALARAAAAMGHWDAFPAGADGVFLAVRTGPNTLRARMFAPTHGVAEDPATGSAAVGLAALIARTDRLGEGRTEFAITQGVEMGRPSGIGLALTLAGGSLTAVDLSGTAVLVAEGRLLV